jgi:hypothetical protein
MFFGQTGQTGQTDKQNSGALLSDLLTFQVRQVRQLPVGRYCV